MDSVSQLGITFTNDSALLLGKSTNKSTNKKESVPGQAIDIRCEDGWYSTTLKPPVSVDTSLDTDTLDTNQQTVVSVETILETMLWKPYLLLLRACYSGGRYSGFSLVTGLVTRILVTIEKQQFPWLQPPTSPLTGALTKRR